MKCRSKNGIRIGYIMQNREKRKHANGILDRVAAVGLHIIDIVETIDARCGKTVGEESNPAFDLGKPIWLDSNVSDFKRHGKTRFTKDNFVEDIDFDFLEMHIIEED